MKENKNVSYKKINQVAEATKLHRRNKYINGTKMLMTINIGFNRP